MQISHASHLHWSEQRRPKSRQQQQQQTPPPNRIPEEKEEEEKKSALTSPPSGRGTSAAKPIDATSIELAANPGHSASIDSNLLTLTSQHSPLASPTSSKGSVGEPDLVLFDIITPKSTALPVPPDGQGPLAAAASNDSAPSASARFSNRHRRSSLLPADELKRQRAALPRLYHAPHLGFEVDDSTSRSRGRSGTEEEAASAATNGVVRDSRNSPACGNGAGMAGGDSAIGVLATAVLARSSSIPLPSPPLSSSSTVVAVAPTISPSSSSSQSSFSSSSSSSLPSPSASAALSSSSSSSSFATVVAAVAEPVLPHHLHHPLGALPLHRPPTITTPDFFLPPSSSAAPSSSPSFSFSSHTYSSSSPPFISSLSASSSSSSSLAHSPSSSSFLLSSSSPSSYSSASNSSCSLPSPHRLPLPVSSS